MTVTASLGLAMRRVPDHAAFGWLPDRGSYQHNEPEDLRDRCPRVEPRHHSDAAWGFAHSDEEKLAPGE